MADEQVKRLYSGISDDRMLNDTTVIGSFFLDDIALFSAFDADLNNAFHTAWTAQIETALDTESDETYQDLVQQATEAMKTAWGNCKNKFQDTKYFIEKAFPNKPLIWNEFGFEDYQEMSRNQNKVYLFMDQFHDTCEKYKVPLIAAGYTQLKIDEIDTIGQEFAGANLEQERMKKKRPVATALRITQLNDVWKTLQRVNQASKVIFRGNWAKLQQYMLPGANNEPRESFTVVGITRTSAGNAAIPGVVVKSLGQDITTTSDDNGAFGLALPPGADTLEATKAGFTTANQPVTIPADGTLEQDITLTPV